MKVFMIMLVVFIVVDVIIVRKRAKKRSLLDQEIYNNVEREKNIRN